MSFLNISISLLLSFGTMILVALLLGQRLRSRSAPEPILVKSRRAIRKRKY